MAARRWLSASLCVAPAAMVVLSSLWSRETMLMETTTSSSRMPPMYIALHKITCICRKTTSRPRAHATHVDTVHVTEF